MRTLLPALFLLGSASAPTAATLHVDPQSELFSIQTAIDSAAAGDTLLLAGTVFEENPLILDKDLTLRSAPGGRAILDGEPQGGGNDGDAGSVLRTVRSFVVLEDLVLRNGKPRPTGAALMVFGGRVEMRRCRVENSVFGVLSVDTNPNPAGELDIEDCEIVDNGLGVQGRRKTRVVRTRIEGNAEAMRAVGAIGMVDVQVVGNGKPGVDSAALVLGASTGRLERVLVRDNWSGEGPAGLWLGIGPFEVVDCTIENNVAESGPAGIFASRVGKGTLIGCTVRGNQARGPLIGVAGLGMDRSSIRASACRIEANDSEQPGGGVAVGHGSVLELFGSQVLDNVSTLSGGGLSVQESTALLDTVVVAGNRAAGGGALAAGAGGQLTVQRSTLAANSADIGAGLYVVSGSASFDRCILAANTGTQTLLCLGSTSFACTDLFGNAQDTICGSDLGGNLAVDPGFCDPAPASGFRDLRLRDDSPLADVPGCGRIGALPAGCSGTRVAPITWSRAKSLYRGGVESSP